MIAKIFKENISGDSDKQHSSILSDLPHMLVHIDSRIYQQEVLEGTSVYKKENMTKTSKAQGRFEVWTHRIS